MNLGTWTWTTRRGLATLHVTCFPGMPLFQFYKPFLPTLRAFLSMVWVLLGPNPLGLGTKKIIMLKHFWANLLICVGSPFCRVASSSHVCVCGVFRVSTPFLGKERPDQHRIAETTLFQHLKKGSKGRLWIIKILILFNLSGPLGTWKIFILRHLWGLWLFEDAGGREVPEESELDQVG